MKIELVNGFGLAATWNKSNEHDFAIIFLYFSIKFKL